MSLDIIQERLDEYNSKSKQEEENALKEICQEIALAGLSRSGLFNIASFQGDTCLRIIHGMRRFSEDLDFVLMNSSSRFLWKTYLDSIKTEFYSFGLSLDVLDRSETSGIVKKAFLKEDSFGKVLALKYPRIRSDLQKILIKLEVDTHPPLGSEYETHYLLYPYPFSIVSQDRESLFASKCHALLCREFVKGRDWFDFLWYVQKKIGINYSLLENALNQAGPFKEKIDKFITKEWVIENLKIKIESIDWDIALKDVEKFIPMDQKHTLISWNKHLFLSTVDKMQTFLK